MSDGGHRVLGFDDAGNFGRARDVFGDANYTEQVLQDALGKADLMEIGPLDEHTRVPAAPARGRRFIALLRRCAAG